METLDVLRGFALLGILAMNIRIMAAPFGAYMYPIGLFELRRREPGSLYLPGHGVRPQDDGPLLDALRWERPALHGEDHRIGPLPAGALVPPDVLAAAHRSACTPT